jgi:lipopolysaccharide export system ATP-binding protein
MSELVTVDVRKVYGGRTVVNSVSIRVETGRVIGLLGPNGAGKTTTFYMVVGLVSPDSGSVLLDGMDITRLPMHKRALRGVGYLAQEASIFRNLTVRENVSSILEFFISDKKLREARTDELLEKLKVTHVQSSMGYALSGGERRRVEIARALTTNPTFLLLDEPFAGVDPIAVQEIQSIISQLKSDGLGILITDHSVRETLQITDHAYVMNQGTLLVEGGIDEITSNPMARKIYLGETFTMDGMTANTGEGNKLNGDTDKCEGKTADKADGS